MHQPISPDKRIQLFPITTQIQPGPRGNEMHIAGLNLVDLAGIYGTPLYLYDQATMDACLNAYQQALTESYPACAEITYAGKAFLCQAMAEWVEQRGLCLDCTGVGEIHIATLAEVSRRHILVHGVSKPLVDLQAAIQYAGTIVVDNLTELNRLIPLVSPNLTSSPDIWLRLRPGVAVDTHTYRQTGQSDSKFGMSAQEFLEAVSLCQQARLPLMGLHFHQGSHFNDPSPLSVAIDTALELIAECQRVFAWTPQIFCPGGGWSVPYHEDDLPHPSESKYVTFIAEKVVQGCQQRKLPLPRLQLEPGRSLVARAGVALYRVVTIKHTGTRRWLLLDGGMADNPRPALYGARYTCLPVINPERPPAGNAWIGGPFCESGDILIENLPMPEIQEGELVALPVSGAYQLSMGSNYNGARRPAVVWLNHQGANLIQDRETLADLTRRDHSLPK